MFIAFTGSTSRAGICVACLKLTTLSRRIINKLYNGLRFSINIGLTSDVIIFACFKTFEHFLFTIFLEISETLNDHIFGTENALSNGKNFSSWF